MATWSELLESKIPALPKQVFLCSGETSSALVWDKLNQILGGYDMHMRVASAEDLSYATFGHSKSLAYVVVNPNTDLLNKIEEVIRGGCIESFFILMEGATLPKDQATEYIKKKAQQCKQYYTITVPKSETAQMKMASFFMLRWSVTKDQAFSVCSLLDFSPARLYLFDIQFRMIIGSSVLSSAAAKNIIEELLGTEAANMVASNILNSVPLAETYSAEFNQEVLGFLANLIDSALAIKAAWSAGASTMSAVCKESGITQFQASRAWGLAHAYSEERLKETRNHLALGFKYADQPDVLGVLSRIF